MIPEGTDRPRRSSGRPFFPTLTPEVKKENRNSFLGADPKTELRRLQGQLDEIDKGAPTVASAFYTLPRGVEVIVVGHGSDAHVQVPVGTNAAPLIRAEMDERATTTGTTVTNILWQVVFLPGRYTVSNLNNLTSSTNVYGLPGQAQNTVLVQSAGDATVPFLGGMSKVSNLIVQAWQSAVAVDLAANGGTVEDVAAFSNGGTILDAHTIRRCDLTSHAGDGTYRGVRGVVVTDSTIWASTSLTAITTPTGTAPRVVNNVTRNPAGGAYTSLSSGAPSGYVVGNDFLGGTLAGDLTGAYLAANRNA